MNNMLKSPFLLRTSALLALSSISTANYAQSEQPFEMTPINNDAINVGEPDQDKGERDKDSEGSCGGAEDDEGTCGGDMDAEGQCGADKPVPDPDEFGYESDTCNLFPELPVCKGDEDDET